ncbi:MAG: histidinol dehydrogenase [Candidatus Tectimicrobiota bacterium]|nr:MAG: histidinol dehydrogenase [Candidatus Tectomicrobia bacterium]
MQIRRLAELDAETRARLLQRARSDVQRVLPQVQAVMEEVRRRGDAAVREYTARFDGVALEALRVTEEELAAARGQVDPALREALEKAKEALEAFHRRQLPRDEVFELRPGVRVGRLWRPIEKVGLYAPGGKATYPSTVLMLGVPAQVAGCPQRVLCIPPRPDGSLPPAMLVAAELVGIRDIFKIGGAQAIAAMAFGTESVPQVYKLFGPGNIYVVAAKLWAASSGLPLAIDCPPGPSEIVIIADDTAPPAFVAADLLSQAEHGEDSAALLLTPSPRLAEQVAAEIARQLPALPTAARIRAALERYGMILVAQDVEACVYFCNVYAPEHVEVMTADPWAVCARLVNAGAVFIGPYAPVSMGDYLTGTNHVIPTGGYARAFSPLSVDAFVRKLEVQELTRDGLRALQEPLRALTAAEGLAAHQHAVDIRLA